MFYGIVAKLIPELALIFYYNEELQACLFFNYKMVFLFICNFGQGLEKLQHVQNMLFTTRKKVGSQL